MIVLIALLVFAAIALRGYIPGAGAPGRGAPVPNAVAVALMPVLLTVSVVILLAGVIASQHRLPLSMPEPDRATEQGNWRLGRIGLLILALLAAFGLLIAVSTAVFYLGVGPEAAPEGSVPRTVTETPAEQTPASPPHPNPAPEALTGTALLLATIAAIVLIVVALSGLVVVAVTSRRKRPDAPLPMPTGEATPADSLARAAEMGLAAMNAPGQDPRTAIIACYLAMERGLAFDRAAAPLASDTPMEVLARAFEHGALHDASARELVALFEEARFSPHDMLEWQRLRAEQLLRIVLADLQGEIVA
ncbi:DUF4129 domain-containing protein [Nocardia sp. XZ_19_385]|uniref:DUF4129 domain-containing protein n=1 Tax=Nocardia sp. XZ_19_385 TaxID=2769488 RepID=UPI0028163925|nr:DUF4129 domain-containing protein [Nocardia sp. XZ_19_385]